MSIRIVLPVTVNAANLLTKSQDKANEGRMARIVDFVWSFVFAEFECGGRCLSFEAFAFHLVANTFLDSPSINRRCCFRVWNISSSFALFPVTRTKSFTSDRMSSLLCAPKRNKCSIFILSSASMCVWVRASFSFNSSFEGHTYTYTEAIVYVSTAH